MRARSRSRCAAHACIASRTSTSTCLWANWSVWPASPVRARARSHSACCMPKAHGDIWRRCPRVHAPPPHSSEPRAGGRSTARARRAGPAPAARGARHTLHLRHDDRIAQQPASVVLTSRAHMCAALRRTRRTDSQRGRRPGPSSARIAARIFTRPALRILGLQLGRRMPACAGTGIVRAVEPRGARTRRIEKHRRGRGAAMGFVDVGR